MTTTNTTTSPNLTTKRIGFLDCTHCRCFRSRKGGFDGREPVRPINGYRPLSLAHEAIGLGHEQVRVAEYNDTHQPPRRWRNA